MWCYGILLAQQAAEESHDLSARAVIARGEGRGGGSVRHAAVLCPQDGIGVVFARFDVRERIVFTIQRIRAVEAVQEGDNLAAGTGGMGANIPLPTPSVMPLCTAQATAFS